MISSATERDHKEAAAYADQRAEERLAYLRGDDEAKERIVSTWLDYELAKPPTHAQIVGLERLDDALR